MHRMSPQDASFLQVDDEAGHMHMGSVIVLAGPAPTYAEVSRFIDAKLVQVPRYRQKVRAVPLAVGRPVWVDDAHFHLPYHLRHTALPHPGGEAELRNLVGRLMSQPLDRSRPLWELWIVEGLEDDRWAIASKVHHCMVDGVSATDILTVLLADRSDPAPPPRAAWLPQDEPSDARLLLDAIVELWTSPYEQLHAARSLLRAPRALAELAAQTVHHNLSFARLGRPPLPSSLSGPIGPHRRWAWARSSLADVRTVRAALGGTVNDVVLATIAGGFRALLLGRREPPTSTPVRSLVPVSVRRPGEHGGHRVAAIFVDLPVGERDPATRLRAVSAQTSDVKNSAQAVAGDMLVSLAGFAPPMLLALGTRLAAQLPQRAVNTVTTNVPGPQRPMYAMGRPVLETFPYVPIANNIRIAIAIMSYDGHLNIGVTGDYDTTPDIDVLCRAIEESMAELVRAAARVDAVVGS
jgi:diacylglycerol O-acyltransferase / wax synthase